MDDKPPEFPNRRIEPFRTSQKPQHSPQAIVPTVPHPTLTLSPLLARNQQFVLFPKLPPELRLRIWHFALPRPRIIHVLGHAVGHCDAFPPDFQSLSSYPLVHPTILSVCQESRAYALQFYAIIYGPHGFCVSFDNSIDTVVIGHKECSNYGHDVTPRTFEKKGYTSLNIGKGALDEGVRVRKLAIQEMDVFRRMHNCRDWYELDEFFLVLGPEGSLRWPQSFREERMRTLGWGKEVVQTEGWGDAVIQNILMRKFEGYRNKYGKRGQEKENGVEVPAVKVVQYGALTVEEDLFCVPLTPLSLRR